MQRENLIGCSRWQPNWCDSRSNIIVTAGSQATRVAKKATVTIPILMGFDPDPVGGGSSPVLRGLVEISRGYRHWAPIYQEKGSSCSKSILPES